VSKAGDGFSPFSSGKGWGSGYRSGDGSLVLLAAIFGPSAQLTAADLARATQKVKVGLIRAASIHDFGEIASEVKSIASI
jgi:hypothetical protein